LTGFTTSVTQFVILQMAFRTFMLVAGTLAFVIVAEEFPAEHRGWGIGMLGALGACGFGFGAILFGVGLANNRVYFYAPVLFFLGLIAVIRGFLGYEEE
jgi:hypothetical protein